MSYDYHAAAEDRPEPQYFAVSTKKFAIMAFLTLGFYELYWFYKNWAYIRDRDSSSIRPFWRMFFAPLHFRKLIRDVDAHSDNLDPIPQAGLLMVAYYVVSALWRLPDPYWLISMFSWVVFLPVVKQIATINRSCPRELLRNSRWTPRHFALGVVTVPLFVLMLIPSPNMTPTTQAIPGASMWKHNVEFLRNAGLLEDGEEVLHFYSQGLLSMQEDGNLLTDSKVVSYWLDEETEEFLVETASYDNIAAIETDYADSFSELTVITVQRTDGSDFILLVSAEENKDTQFVDTLESNLP